MQANRKSGNSCAKNFVSLYHRIQSSELKYVKVSKSLFILSLEYGKVKLLTESPHKFFSQLAEASDQGLS